MLGLVERLVWGGSCLVEAYSYVCLQANASLSEQANCIHVNTKLLPIVLVFWKGGVVKIGKREWDVAEWWERLTVNAKVATVIGSFPPSSDTVESEGRKMKQWRITHKKISKRGWDVAEWWERLTVNAKVETVLGSIPASFDTVLRQNVASHNVYVTLRNITKRKSF